MSRPRISPLWLGILIGIPTLAALLLNSCSADSQKFTEFSETYEKLHEAGDVEGILDLIEIQGHDPAVERQVRRALSEETRWPIARTRYESLSTEEAQTLSASYPAPPQWRFLVTLDTEDHLTASWLVGETPEGIRLLLKSQ